MRIATTLLLCALLCAAALPAQDRVRIGTWNLEQLGFREQRREDDDYRKIAAAITRIGFDLLAIQEIGGPEPLRVLSRHLGSDWKFVLGSTGLFRSDPGRISVGFLWNSARLELLQAEELLELPRRVDDLPIFHRVPVSAVFRSRDGGLDFRAVTVHLKASRGTVNESKRVAEVAQLAGYLRRLLDDPREDRDLVVLGDFNHTYGAPAYAELMKHDLVTYVKPEQLRPTIIHFDDPIDHVAYSGGLGEEILLDSHTVHGGAAGADRDAWRKSYSDHIPVSIELDDSRDRDPAARFAKAVDRQRLWAGGRAAAEDASAPAEPRGPAFQAGTAVTVITRVGDVRQTYRGTLLDRLGGWVKLDLGPGRARIAIPAAHVEEVREVRD